MSGKMLILLGLVTSAALMYFCIDSKKDTLYAKLNPVSIPTAAIADEVPKIVKKEVIKPETIVEKKAPNFAYISGAQEKFAAYLSTEDKESNITSYIDELCKESTCVKKIEFFEDIKPYAFSKETFELISYAKKENLKDFSLFISQNNLKVNGELKTQEQLDTIKPFFDNFINKGYKIDNALKSDNLTPLIKEEILKEEITQEEELDILVAPLHTSTEDAGEQITDIINANTITFDYRSSKISKDSKKTLDTVVDILLGLDDVSIEVAGYTDSKGDAIYNKVLSQKRADAVRTYLIKAGIRRKLLKSIGYGEESPIASPEDTINRRVEIHLSEGK